MANVEVNVPDNMGEVIMAAVQRRIDAALSIAPEVGKIIKDRAILDNEDVDGNQMPSKQPKPKGNPKNFPNLALIDSGNMMDNDRWTTNRVSASEVVVAYQPPDYFEHLISKSPELGGRKWLTRDRVNPTAWAEIQAEMTKRFKEGSD